MHLHIYIPHLEKAGDLAHIAGKGWGLGRVPVDDELYRSSFIWKVLYAITWSGRHTRPREQNLLNTGSVARAGMAVARCKKVLRRRLFFSTCSASLSSCAYGLSGMDGTIICRV